LFLACLSSRAPLRIEPEQSTLLRVGDVAAVQVTDTEEVTGSAGEALVFVRQSRGRLTRTYVYQAVRAGNQTIVVTPTNLHDGDCISCVTAHYFVTVVQ
jgi:hypothetical protein